MLKVGDVLQGRYRVDSQLGRGGMGAVYRARDTRLNVLVAVKEMEPQPGLEPHLLQEMRSQFHQEATVLARLNHPHLVGVTDFFEEGDSVYLVMRFIEGESLAQRITRTGPIPEHQVVAWTGQLLDALAYCHQNGVIHRDIKPQNIIIRPDGQVVLVDFGLVKLWNPSDPRTVTAVRGMGTPQYAPPEQYEVETGHTEPRSDLYSLGATMYHALTGQVPPTATLRIASPEEFVPVRSLASRISTRTAAAIEKAMELARSHRWPSAAEMALGLGLAVSRTGMAKHETAMQTYAPVDTVRIPPLSVSDSLTRPKRKGAWWIAGILGGLLLAAAVIAVLLLLRGYGAAWLSVSPGNRPPTTSESVAPTDAPTPTATRAATSTPRPTSTVTTTPRATATRRPLVAGTPMPTRTVRPTATPTVEAVATATPRAAASGSPTPSPAPLTSGALIDFEQWGTWRRGDQPYGDLVQTQERVKSGSYAAKLTYDFPAVADDYVVFIRSLSLAGQPNQFGLWTYGDGSGHFVNLWLQDSAGEVWSVALGRLGGAGWQQLVGSLAPGLPWPSGHISGPDNGSVDYPVKFYALVVDRPGTGPGQGQVYFDDLTAWRTGVAAPTPAPTTAAVVQATATAAPPPSGEVGRIVFTLQAGDAYYLYSTDPAWSQMQELGLTDWSHSTCAGAAVASTLAGYSVNLYGMSRCGITERTDACPSPDGNYKLVTSFVEDVGHDVLIQNVASGALQWYYQGRLNTGVGIQWSSTSQVVMFAVGKTANVIRPGVEGYKQAVPAFSEEWSPQFSPDGSLIYYLRPVGSEGASDVFAIGIDGTGERNLTNAPLAHKLCPRWRW